MANADGGTTIIVALISAFATVAVATIGVLASRWNTARDRRAAPREKDSGLMTKVYNDLRRDLAGQKRANARLRQENARLLSILEERGWSD